MRVSMWVESICMVNACLWGSLDFLLTSCLESGGGTQHAFREMLQQTSFWFVRSNMLIKPLFHRHLNHCQACRDTSSPNCPPSSFVSSSLFCSGAVLPHCPDLHRKPSVLASSSRYLSYDARRLTQSLKTIPTPTRTIVTPSSLSFWIFSAWSVAENDPQKQSCQTPSVYSSCSSSCCSLSLRN